MTWQIPWVTAGVNEIPLDIARVFAYAATAGREGVVSSNDLLVTPTATPSGSIQVATGVFTAVSRFLGASHESYVGRNASAAVTTVVPATGATSLTQLVYAHVTDPGQSGQPGTAAAVETRVITAPSGVTRLQDVAGYENQTGYALARITRPANSTTVLASHITDLRALLEEGVSPVGMITPFAGNVAPATWMFPTGQALSRTGYSRLFAVIGTTYGAGDGSTTFNLPNMGGRVPVGVNGSHPLGQTGGAETVTLTTAQIPAHSHAGTALGAGAHTPTGSANAAGGHAHSASASNSGTHSHGYQAPAVRANIQFATPGSEMYAARAAASTDLIGDHTHNITVNAVGDHTHSLTLDAVSNHTHALQIDNTGGGGAHENMQPFLAVNYIIKVS